MTGPAVLFVFLVTTWEACPPVVAVEDYNLTGADCLERLRSYDGPGTPSCEIEGLESAVLAAEQPVNLEALK